MVTLKEYLNSDRIDYFPFGSKGYIMDWLLRTEQYWIRRYIRALRKEEFYMNYKRNKILQYYFSRKKNLLGIRLGFFINAGCFDIGLKIYHYGSIIVNPKSRIGKNCTIHGALEVKVLFRMILPLLGIMLILDRMRKFWVEYILQTE